MNNFVKLEGNLGKDPELRTTQNGIKVATFSIAVTREKGKDKDLVTDWFNIVAWGDEAELVMLNLKKGTRIQAAGKLQNRSYEDREGKKVNITEVWLDNFWLAPKKPAEEKSNFENGSLFSDAELPF